MNTAFILEVADAIEQHSIADLGFNMEDYIADNTERAASNYRHIRDLSGHNCNTVACIAGWAVHVQEKPEAIYRSSYERVKRIDGIATFYAAREYMGLDYELADKLFAPTYFSEWSKITPAVAAATLRHLAATGEVLYILGQNEQYLNGRRVVYRID